LTDGRRETQTLRRSAARRETQPGTAIAAADLRDKVSPAAQRFINGYTPFKIHLS
jgi:hypothetical protein